MKSIKVFLITAFVVAKILGVAPDFQAISPKALFSMAYDTKDKMQDHEDTNKKYINILKEATEGQRK